MNGQEFSGNKIKPLESSITRGKAQMVVNGYSTGDTITVFYNPGKPEEAVISVGEQNYLYIFILASLALVVFSIIKLLS